MKLKLMSLLKKKQIIYRRSVMSIFENKIKERMTIINY